jgi:hypothetical protein
MYVCSQSNQCKRKEYTKLLAEMRKIEKDFYKKYDSTLENVSDMTSFAIPRKFILYFEI